MTRAIGQARQVGSVTVWQLLASGKLEVMDHLDSWQRQFRR
jgi:hypothetical protein